MTRYLLEGKPIQGNAPIEIGEIQYLRGVDGLTSEEREKFGITDIIEEPYPSAELSDISEDPKKPGSWIVTPWTGERLIMALLAEAKNQRWLREQGGFDIGGLHVDTDDRSKSLILGARLLAQDDPTYTAQWDVGGVPVTLNADQVIAMSKAVGKLIDQCFKIYSGLYADIQSGKVTTLSQVRDAFKG